MQTGLRQVGDTVEDNLLGSIRYGFQCMRNTDGNSTRQSAAAWLLQVGTPAAVFGIVAMPVFG